MTDRSPTPCDDVLAALMATLDGERPTVPPDVIEAHLEGCGACRATAEELTGVHARLAELTYDGPQVHLWPAVSARVAPNTNDRRERFAIAIIVALCVAWRTGQLLFELPFPIVNAVVPLAALALAAWLVGDPLAIRMTTPELRQERA